jgi:hypothetical protein
MMCSEFFLQMDLGLMSLSPWVATQSFTGKISFRAAWELVLDLVDVLEDA